jgi:hypothetical protein
MPEKLVLLSPPVSVSNRKWYPVIRVSVRIHQQGGWFSSDPVAILIEENGAWYFVALDNGISVWDLFTSGSPDC